MTSSYSFQIFATCSTFYVPLLVILFLYWKIYQTARKRIHRRRPKQILRQNLVLVLFEFAQLTRCFVPPLTTFYFGNFSKHRHPFIRESDRSPFASYQRRTKNRKYQRWVSSRDIQQLPMTAAPIDVVSIRIPLLTATRRLRYALPFIFRTKQ